MTKQISTSSVRVLLSVDDERERMHTFSMMPASTGTQKGERQRHGKRRHGRRRWRGGKKAA